MKHSNEFRSNLYLLFFLFGKETRTAKAPFIRLLHTSHSAGNAANPAKIVGRLCGPILNYAQKSIPIFRSLRFLNFTLLWILKFSGLRLDTSENFVAKDIYY